MTTYIHPIREQIEQLMSQGYKGPIVMVNLLKFKPDGGRETYEKYYEANKKLSYGKTITRVVYRGHGLMPLIGPEEWDEIALYEYASIQAFLDMARNPEYQEVAKYRTEALLDSRLYCTIEKETFDSQ
jgi:uncharacterized protein (DUF1330 family)